MIELYASIIPESFRWWHLPAVFLAGLIGEGYGTLVGGGGILIQFTLLTLGIPIRSVVATDQAGSLGASLGIVSALPKNTWVNKRLILLLGIPVFIGGIVGTFFLIYLDPILVKYVLIAGLILLMIKMISENAVQYVETDKVKVKLKQYPLIFSTMTMLGIYMNVSGVGVGTFQRFAFVNLLKMRMIDSIGIGNLIAIPIGIFSFVATSVAGLIVWPYLIMLWLGTFIGGRYVTKYLRKVSDSVLRTILLIIVIIYLSYLLYTIR